MQDLHVVQLNVNLTLSYNFEEILSRVTMIQIGVLASLVCSHTKVMKVNEDSDIRLFLRELLHCNSVSITTDPKHFGMVPLEIGRVISKHKFNSFLYYSLRVRIK